MSGRHYPPAYLRYLKARLWNLARPSFWGTAIFLSVVGLVIKEYWTNPDFLTQWQNGKVTSSESGNSSLSEEDRAIAADIDNLPVLSFDAESESLLSNPSQFSRKRQKKSNIDTTLLDDLINAQKKSPNPVPFNSSLEKVTPTATPNIENPFLSSAKILLRGGNSQNGSNLFGVNSLNPSGMKSVEDTYTAGGMGIINQGKLTQNPDVLNPLKKAVEQSNQGNIQKFNGSTLNPTNVPGKVLETNSLLNSKPVSANNNIATYGINDSSNGSSYSLPNLPNKLQNPYNNYPGTQSLRTGNIQPVNSDNNYSGTQNLRTGNIQPGATNQLQNPYNNFNNSQSLSTVKTPVNGVSSNSNNFLPRSNSYSGQISNQSAVTPINSNYGNQNLQQYNQLQQPNKLPENLTDWLKKND
ncbi:MAG: hypothetical protein QNJ47_07235 [Nostocaceae cyanobacterium]|nr:hypothetical protein [Nostocaceae cyanobacterium]